MCLYVCLCVNTKQPKPETALRAIQDRRPLRGFQSLPTLMRTCVLTLVCWQSESASFQPDLDSIPDIISWRAANCYWRHTNTPSSRAKPEIISAKRVGPRFRHRRFRIVIESVLILRSIFAGTTLAIAFLIITQYLWLRAASPSARSSALFNVANSWVQTRAPVPQSPSHSCAPDHPQRWANQRAGLPESTTSILAAAGLTATTLCITTRMRRAQHHFGEAFYINAAPPR